MTATAITYFAIGATVLWGGLITTLIISTKTKNNCLLIPI